MIYFIMQRHEYVLLFSSVPIKPFFPADYPFPSNLFIVHQPEEDRSAVAGRSIANLQETVHQLANGLLIEVKVIKDNVDTATAYR